MYIQAVLDNGKLIFHNPLYLKPERIEVGVVIPDEAILDEMNNSQVPPVEMVKFQPSTSIRSQLNEILGKYAGKRPAVSPARDKAAWHQHLDAKYG